MTKVDDINLTLRHLWKRTVEDGNWPENLPLLWPLQYPPLQPGGIVFVGLNPSTAGRGISPDTYTLNSPTDLDDDNKSRQLADEVAFHLGRVDSQHMYPYFKPFGEVTPAGLHWEHVDLFAVRHRDQGTVQAAMGLHDEWTAFAGEQFGIAHLLLQAVKPICVVVVNALASSLVSKKLGVSALDEEAGCRWLALNGRPVPIFMTSMLSGQRALDVHSRERLAWHVRRVVAGSPGQPGRGMERPSWPPDAIR